MYVIAGYRTDIRNDIWCGQCACQKCGRVSDFHLMKMKYVGTMFYIPFIFYTSGRMIVCDTCGTYARLKRAEYEKVRKIQEEILYSNQFPAHIVKKDCDPKVLKLTLKRTVLIFSIILTVMSLGAAFFVLIPAVISFRRANKKYGVYRKMIENRCGDQDRY